MYSTAHKILFSLRASTTARGVPEPAQFSRFIKLALKGYESVFTSAAPRPVVSVSMFHFCARSSFTDLLNAPISVDDALSSRDLTQVRLARWRAVLSLAFFGALRSSEYIESALLGSCVSFDAPSSSALVHLRSFLPSHSLATLWEAVVSGLHPKAVASVTILSSKCNSEPESRLIGRDISDPSLCPVAALALWFVLRPASDGDSPFFAFALALQAISVAFPATRSSPPYVSTSQPPAS